MKLTQFLAFLAHCEAEMAEPFRVKTWPDAKYLENFSLVNLRNFSVEPVNDFFKKKGEQSHQILTDIGFRRHVHFQIFVKNYRHARVRTKIQSKSS